MVDTVKFNGHATPLHTVKDIKPGETFLAGTLYMMTTRDGGNGMAVVVDMCTGYLTEFPGRMPVTRVEAELSIVKE